LVSVILEYLQLLRVSDPQTLGNLVSEIKHIWTPGHSSRVQAQKILNKLVELNQIIRGNGWYAVKDYKGNFLEHDQLITKCLAQLLSLFPESLIKREVSLPVGLRADSIILLIRKGGDALCLVLEVCLNETPEYLNQKIQTWKEWEEAPAVLSKIFNCSIPHFTIAVYGEECPKEIILFDQLIERLKNEN